MNLSKKVKLNIKKDIKMKDIFHSLSSDRSLSKYLNNLPDTINYNLSDGFTDVYLYDGEEKKKISKLMVNYKENSGFITFSDKINYRWELNHITIKEFDVDNLCFSKIYLDFLRIYNKGIELSNEDIELNKEYFFTFRSCY